MKRRDITACVVWVCLAALPAELLAQYGNRANPFGLPDPRVRRAQRERAVAVFGKGARNIVESLGDDAVAALFACTKPVAVKLTEFHASGEMDTLPRPRDLLRVIAQPGHGDDVARWAMQHRAELADPDHFDAYVLSPLDYALGLKQLDDGAAEAQSRRLHHAAVTMPLPTDERLVIAGLAAVVLLLLICLWRRRQSTV